MNQQKGQDVRNHMDIESMSLEQEQKVKTGQDVEPQAEKWNNRSPDRYKKNPIDKE